MDHVVVQPSWAQEVIVIARRESERERERERGGHWGSHQWHCLEAELRRWLHDGAQKRRLVVLRWGDIGARVGAVDNGGALIAPFIEP
jgi:hypothetical protein